MTWTNQLSGPAVSVVVACRVCRAGPTSSSQRDFGTPIMSASLGPSTHLITEMRIGLMSTPPGPDMYLLA
jgi:hypothetical protein